MNIADAPIHTALVELRQYTLHSGARDTLVELFDRELVETQEACGMSVIGQFRDLDRPDRFVWLRGFADGASRTAALEAFYGGPDWLAHREAANATMFAFDDVLLLRPAVPGAGFALDRRNRPSPDRSAAASSSLFEAVVCWVPPDRLEDFSQRFAAGLVPALQAAGSQVVASLVTDRSPNGFPHLPVREGVSVFVWLVRQSGTDQPASLPPELAELAIGEPLRLRLTPTARSLLR